MEVLPSGFVIFCDDIRQEVGNKSSLIGVYMSDMVLNHPTLPIALAKLGILIQYMQPIDDVKDYRIEIHLPGGDPEKPIAHADVAASEVKPTGKTALGSDATKIAARMHLVMAPVEIKEAGTLKVMITRAGEKAIELGKLEILHSPPVPAAR